MELSKTYFQVISDLYLLNSQCLKLNSQLRSLSTVTDSKDQSSNLIIISFYIIERISFTHSFTDEESQPPQPWYYLNQFGFKSEITQKDLRVFFKDLKNPLKTSFPSGGNFEDMKQDLEVYELLEPSKGINLVNSIKKSLIEVKQTLEQSLQTIQNKMGLGAKALKILSQKEENVMIRGGDSSRVFRMKTEEKYLNFFKMEFEVELAHERALDHMEECKSVLERYFEEIDFTVEQVEQFKPFLKGSKLLSSKEQRVLKKWLKESNYNEINNCRLINKGASNNVPSLSDGRYLFLIKEKIHDGPFEQICGGVSYLDGDRNYSHATTLNDVMNQRFYQKNSKAQSPQEFYFSFPKGKIVKSQNIFNNLYNSICNGYSISHIFEQNNSHPKNQFFQTCTKYEIWKIE